MPILDTTSLQKAYRKDVTMGKVIVSGFALSIDGYGAGPDQSPEQPLGKGGEDRWMLATRAFQQTHGQGGGTEGIDNDYAARFTQGFGSFILGRNMFGPIRGDWPDDEWNGWWGDNPPYHAPTFVLTHYPRSSIAMEGGTTFHFVTDGIGAALERARAAAGGRNVTIGGGVATVRQYLQAGLVDEVHFAISPLVLGRGEAMFAGIDLPALGYRIIKHDATAAATHIVLGR
jgi:dihydrofolate reductase